LKLEIIIFIQFAGVLANAIKTQPDGTFSIEEVKRSFRPQGDHFTKSSLICIENTHMASGGRALPQDWIDEVNCTYYFPNTCSKGHGFDENTL